MEYRGEISIAVATSALSPAYELQFFFFFFFFRLPFSLSLFPAPFLAFISFLASNVVAAPAAATISSETARGTKRNERPPLNLFAGERKGASRAVPRASYAAF